MMNLWASNTNGACRKMALVPVLGLCLGLGACESPGDFERYSSVAAGCPEVEVLSDAAEATYFRPDGGEDLTDVLARASIADYSGGCSYYPEEVSIELRMVLSVEAGPAFTARDQVVGYKVLVVDAGSGQVYGGQELEAVIEIPPDLNYVEQVEELDLDIPLDNPAQGEQRIIVLALSLTQAQLDYNRAQR